MKIIITFLATLLLAGCAHASKTYLPSGENGYTINCSGTALTWGNCYKKAGDLCGSKGYDVIAVNGERGAAVIANPSLLYGSTTISRSMLIKCK